MTRCSRPPTSPTTGPPPPRGRRAGRRCAGSPGLGLAGLARLLAGSSVRWIASQPDTCQRVYFANHTSHLDALIVWSSLPQSVRELTRPAAAKDYWSRGIVRRWLAQEVFDAILIVELVPVHIDNLNRVLPRGEFLPVPLLSCISFGPPLWLERGEPKLDFLARARQAVLALKE